MDDIRNKIVQLENLKIQYINYINQTIEEYKKELQQKCSELGHKFYVQPDYDRTYNVCYNCGFSQ